MKQITVSVIDPVGLHARPATVAVNAASTVSYTHLEWCTCTAGYQSCH